MANQPLYGILDKPVYGVENQPVYSDLVYDDDYIYVTFTGLWYPVATPPGWFWDGHVWSMGYTDNYGLYFGRTISDATEKASMVYWLPIYGVYGTTEWGGNPGSSTWPGPYTARFDYGAMVTNDYGKGNDGTNDYYEIIVRCNRYEDAGINQTTNNYCTVRSWKNLNTIEDTFATPVTAFTSPYYPTVAICTIRWTPATTTLEFV
jgi:hypothetical protein